MNAKYVVASKKNKTIRSFDKAFSVAAFMLGRRFDEWCIYQRQDGLPCDAIACEKVLEAREKICHSGDPAIPMGQAPVFPDSPK